LRTIPKIMPFHTTCLSFSNKQTAFDLLEHGKINEASQIFAALMKERDPDIVANQALCICQIPNRAAEAEGLAAKAVAMAPTDPKYQIIQSHVLREIGKADLAVKYLSVIVDFYPLDWSLHYALGRGLNRNWQRFGPAILSFDTSLSLKPGNPDAFYWRGEAQFWLDTCEDDPFEWLQNKFDGYLRKPYYDGLRSFREGKFDTALKHFSEAPIAWRNDTSDLWSWKGECELALGKFDAALASFEKALALNPNDALSLHGKGEVFTKQGDAKKGTEAKTLALEMNRLYWKTDYFRVKEPIQKGV